MAAIRLRTSRERALRELAAGDREVIRLMEERLTAEGALSEQFAHRRVTLRRRAAPPEDRQGRRAQ